MNKEVIKKKIESLNRDREICLNYRKQSYKDGNVTDAVFYMGQETILNNELIFFQNSLQDLENEK